MKQTRVRKDKNELKESVYRLQSVRQVNLVERANAEVETDALITKEKKVEKGGNIINGIFPLF